MEAHMRALVLSGGGSKSAYSVGVLQHLLGNLEIKYDAIVGVSSGAICAAFLGMFSHGYEKESIDALSKIWLSLNNEKIYQRWNPFGRFHVLWKLGFFDNSPMKDLIRDSISLEKIRLSGKNITVGTVSLTSGKYTNFDQNSDDFIGAVISSAAFPVMFEPVMIGNQLWSDGGIKSISPIHTAIMLGADQIDVIATSPETRDKRWIDKPSIIDIIKRSFDLFTEKILSNDIEKAILYNKLASVGLTEKKCVQLNIIRPDYNLIEDLLDFHPTKIAEMIQKGYHDAKLKYTV